MTPEKKQEIMIELRRIIGVSVEDANEVIERYNWFSVNECGQWYLHCVEPFQHAYGWYGNGNDVAMGVIDMTGIDWRKSKERIG